MGANRLTHIRGSQSAALATKSALRGSPTAAPAVPHHCHLPVNVSSVFKIFANVSTGSQRPKYTRLDEEVCIGSFATASAA